MQVYSVPLSLRYPTGPHLRSKSLNQITMPTNIHILQKNVTTAGTSVQLPAQSVDPDQEVTIKAKMANAGSVYVGDS